MAKRLCMTGPGRVLDRAAKKGKLKLYVDVSPLEMWGKAASEHGRLEIQIKTAGMKEPITVTADPKSWCLLLEDAAIPRTRLAELEQLITDETDVAITVAYTPQPTLGFDDADQK